MYGINSLLYFYCVYFINLKFRSFLICELPCLTRHISPWCQPLPPHAAMLCAWDQRPNRFDQRPTDQPTKKKRLVYQAVPGAWREKEKGVSLVMFGQFGAACLLVAHWFFNWPLPSLLTNDVAVSHWLGDAECSLWLGEPAVDISGSAMSCFSASLMAFSLTLPMKLFMAASVCLIMVKLASCINIPEIQHKAEVLGRMMLLR